jgi:hypothetical protein
MLILDALSSVVVTALLNHKYCPIIAHTMKTGKLLGLCILILEL